MIDDRLGAINRALLCLEVARHRRLPVAAVVLNRVVPDDPGPAATFHAEAIAARECVRVLGPMPFGGTAPELATLLP